MRIASPSTVLAWIGEPEPMEIVRAERTSRTFAPQLQDTFAIGVVEHGTTRVRYRGAEVTHQPGGVLVIEPGEVHTGAPVGCDAWSYRMIHASAAPFRRLAGLPAAREGTPLFAAGWYADAELAARFVAAHATLERAALAAEPLPLEAALADVLGALVRRHAAHGACAAEDAASAGARRTVRCVTEYLRAHLGQPVRLTQLAEVAELGPFALIRLFRRVVGVPPYAYLELLRVDRARQLLRAGAAIPDVAYSTGFSDQSHLTRHFRRVVGVPPGQYARGHARCVAARRVA